MQNHERNHTACEDQIAARQVNEKETGREKETSETSLLNKYII